MKRWRLWGGLAVVAALGLLGGADLWSRNGTPAPLTQAVVSNRANAGEAETLQTAFTRIAEQIGPSVVSIATEQIERVRQYFRVHPFFGPQGDPFEEFFRQFYGDTPQREFKRFGLGSGFILDARGFVLTNNHVVADADKITVVLPDGREFTGEVKGKDPRSDLAMVQIEGTELTVAPLGDSDGVRVGQWAVALGYPFGVVEKHGATPQPLLGPEPTITVGVISAINRNMPRMGQADRLAMGLIQTDADINRGNSGGPLVNLYGEVIGINVAVVTDPGTFGKAGFAIPVNKAKSILEALIEGKEIIYGWLGIHIQDISQDVAEFYKLKSREGVLVYQVLPDSPAAEAGLQDGDLIKTFEGKAVANTRELIDQVSATKAGRRINVGILRDGKRMMIPVTVGKRPSDVELAGGGTSEEWRGLTVSDLSPEFAEQFEVPAGMTGVLVVEVAPGSLSAQAGLRPGDVINEINRTRVESLSDYGSAIARVKGNALVRTHRGYFVVKTE